MLSVGQIEKKKYAFILLTLYFNFNFKLYTTIYSRLYRLQYVNSTKINYSK